jgi:hypothetical protein
LPAAERQREQERKLREHGCPHGVDGYNPERPCVVRQDTGRQLMAAEEVEAAGDAAEQARHLYRESVTAELPLSGRTLGERFGRSDRWGRRRIAEVRADGADSDAEQADVRAEQADSDAEQADRAERRGGTGRDGTGQRQHERRPIVRRVAAV